jgi:hypothetical protein
LLEYGLALAIFDPHDWEETPLSATVKGRRGSTSSTYSFRVRGFKNEAIAPIEQGPDINSPLAWYYLANNPSILEFLCERVRQQPVFKQQLHDYIELSKTDTKWRTAAANAIKILVRVGIQFNGADLRRIRIPGADLSYGVFEGTQFQEADLRQVSLRGTWLRQADLSRAQMGSVQFGELPFLKEDFRVHSCAYSPDGTSLTLGLQNGDVKVYSTSSWELIWTLSGHREMVRSVAYSPKGDMIVSGSSDGTARLWGVESGTCIFTLRGDSGEVNGVAFSPRGDTIASVSDDKTVRVWNVATGDCRLILNGHTRIVRCIVYSPKGDRIASGSYDRTVRLWDIETEECLLTLSGHSGIIYGIAYSPRADCLRQC